jgi:hypothetical protein
LITPLMIFLILKYGMVGAGISWLVLNLLTLPTYMYFLHRRFLPGELGRWCLHSVVQPLLAALPCVVLGRWLVPHTDSRLLTLCFVGLVWCAAFTASVIVIPGIRLMIMQAARKIFEFVSSKMSLNAHSDV